MDHFGDKASPRRIKKLVNLQFVMTHVLVKVSHLSAAASQDGTSFDWFMSCHMCLSRCLTFRQQPVKMAHLSTGSCHVTCACQGVSPFGSTQSRWHIFRLVHVIMSCHMYLSRCLTFYTVKMAHLFAVFSCVIIVCYLEAVHRFYESRRRLFSDDQPSRREKAGKVKKKCKKIVQQKKVNVHAYRITYYFLLLLL